MAPYLTQYKFTNTKKPEKQSKLVKTIDWYHVLAVHFYELKGMQALHIVSKDKIVPTLDILGGFGAL